MKYPDSTVQFSGKVRSFLTGHIISMQLTVDNLPHRKHKNVQIDSLRPAGNCHGKVLQKIHAVKNELDSVGPPDFHWNHMQPRVDLNESIFHRVFNHTLGIIHRLFKGT